MWSVEEKPGKNDEKHCFKSGTTLLHASKKPSFLVYKYVVESRPLRCLLSLWEFILVNVFLCRFQAYNLAFWVA